VAREGLLYFILTTHGRGGPRRKYWGQDKKLTTFLVIALKTQAKTTKSTLQKLPLYNLLLVLLLHTAVVSKDLGGEGKTQVGGGAIVPCPNVKPPLTHGVD